jgi:phosphoribosylformylglycinamidine synthase subunit PurQ / glutaminase
MAQPNVLILRAPGTNCDEETAFAFQQAGAKTELIHVNRLLESPDLFTKFQVLCIPGGFSYGDDVAAGRILANQIQHHLAEHLMEFKAAQKLILGICNGFQVLLKSGILVEPDHHNGPAATLTCNDSGKFEDRWVRLRVSGSKSVFFDGIESMYLPVAHAEGKFVASGEEQLQQLDAADQLVLRYLPLSENSESPADGTVPYPDNPNGSMADVAGVCDSTGRVLGLMPHPERHIDPTHHPRWTRGEASLTGDGMRVFANAVSFLA